MPDVRYEPACFHSGRVLTRWWLCRALAEAEKASLSISETPPAPEPLCFVCIQPEWSGSLTVDSGAKAWSPDLWETESMQLCNYYCEAGKILFFVNVPCLMQQERVLGAGHQNYSVKSLICSFMSPVRSDFWGVLGLFVQQLDSRGCQTPRGSAPRPRSSHASPEFPAGSSAPAPAVRLEPGEPQVPSGRELCWPVWMCQHFQPRL